MGWYPLSPPPVDRVRHSLTYRLFECAIGGKCQQP